MEDTQALDDQLDLLPEDIHDAGDLKVGSLKVSYADGKSETHPLYTGQNFVARRSAQRHRDDDKVQAWKRENPGAALHGIFLESASVSSPHAIIYVEARGDFCFVKDLGSKNKTLMEGSTGSVVLQTGDRYAIHSGAAVKFGNIGCTIRYSAQPRETPAPDAEAPAQAHPSGLEATQAYDAVEATAAAEEVRQHSGSQLQRARAAVAASEAAPATAPLQVPLYDATQIEVDARPAQVTAAPVPAQLLQTLQLGRPLSGAPEGASEGQEQGQPRQTGVSMGFDDGDSVWLPQLTGGPSHQARASEQEIMSPPKEDTPVMPGAHPGNPPRQSPRPHEQATLPADEPLQGGMGEPTLAEALTEADLQRSQHDESGNLDEPAQALSGRSDRQPAYPASMESMLAVDEEEGDLPVARAQRRGVLVLDDTLPVDEQHTTGAQAKVQPDQATEPGLAITRADAQQPVDAQHADGAAGVLPDMLQQLGLDSPGLPDQAGGRQGAEGQDLATAGEPEQAAPAAEPGSGALRPSTQEPDQAAPAWTPLASPDGWRSKRKPRSTETSPAPKSEGPHPGSSNAAEPSRESAPVAVGVEGQVARVAEHGARRQYVQEGSGQAQDLQEGSWRVKQHLQAEPEGPAPAAEQQSPLAPPPQARAAPAAQQPDEAAEQQPDLATAAQGTPAKQQQPGLRPETQGVTSGQMFAALANVGNLAGIYPDSQAEPAGQVPARVPPPALPEQGSPRDKSPGHAQTSGGPAGELQQEVAGAPLRDTGVAAAAVVGEAVPPQSASKVETAPDQPGADREGSATAQAGQTKGKGRASGQAAGAKGRPGSAGAASLIPAADTVPATEAPSAQPGKQRAGAPAAAAQPEHSEYSFPDTGPDSNPPVRFERAAARATRLASASAAQQEAEQAADDMPESMAGPRTVADRSKAAGGKGAKRKAAAAQTSKSVERRAAYAVVEPKGHGTAEQPDEEPEEALVKATRERRRTANTAQPKAGDAPASARPKRSSKKAAAAVEAAAERNTRAEVPEKPCLVAGNTDVQEEAGVDNPPKDRSSGRARGRKTPTPAGKSETSEKGEEKQAKTDAAADAEVPQAEYKVSRTTRAAQRKGEDPEQADAGTAGAAQQAKRDTGKVPVDARKKRADKAGSEVTDSSSKRLAGLTESQAAADTLAKVKRGRRFSVIHEDDEAPGQKQPLQSQAAPTKGARRSNRAASAQEPQEAAAKQPEERHRLSAKRARRSARAETPQELAAAEPEPEQVQQPAAKISKRVSRTVLPRVEVSEPDAKPQPAAKKGKRASQDDIPQESPAQPEDALAPLSKRAKQTRSSRAGREASNPVQPQAAKAGKRASAKPPQPDSEPSAAPEEDSGPSATAGAHSLRPGGPSLRTETPDRQLRAAASRPIVVLISSCIDAKLRKSMTKTIERLDGAVTASPEDFTVFVTLEPAKGQKERGFIKSLNTLSALACGAPIVSEKWVDGCSRSGAFLDARDHLLQDAAAEAKLGFNLTHAWEAAQQGLLLDSTAVFLTPGLTATEADKGEGLRMLIARAGGSVAQTVPQLDSSGTSQGLILGNEKDVGKEKAWAKRSCTGTFPVIGRTEFVNALLQQRMELASCSLFTT